MLQRRFFCQSLADLRQCDPSANAEDSHKIIIKLQLTGKCHLILKFCDAVEKPLVHLCTFAKSVRVLLHHSYTENVTAGS